MVQGGVNLKSPFVEVRQKDSISQVSRELGVSMENVSNRKSGRSMPNVVSLVKLVDYFGCSADHLLGRIGSRDII